MRREREKEAPAVKIPHDPYNEQVVVAAMMIASERDVGLLSRVPADWFLVEEHAVIWAALLEARRRGLEPSAELLVQLSGGKASQRYVEQLGERHPSCPPNLAHHVAVLEWDKARGAAVSGPIADLLSALKSPTSSPERVRALARAVGAAFDGGRRCSRDSAQLMREQIARIGARANGEASFPYGVEGLDRYEDGRWRLVPGAAPGQVTVITAVAGSGKSTLAVNIALGLARQGRRVGIGAWEMGAGVTLELLALVSLGWSRYRFTTGDFEPEELTELGARMEAISEYVKFWDLPCWGGPVHEDERRSKRRSNEEALDRIHALIEGDAVDVAIFDLWKRAMPETDPDEEEHALTRQQAIFERTGVHGILIQQQRLKDIEMRASKRPTRDGIKGSSGWVEVADTIFGVHNPALWKRAEVDTLEIDILKQRYSKWPLAVEFDFDPDRGQITRGRSIEYDPPVTAGGKRDDFAEKFGKGSGNGGRKGSRDRGGAGGGDD